MAVDPTGDDSRRRAVAAAYAADDEVADADRLCGWLHGEIERHLLSITEVPVASWNLRASIEECRMTPHRGSVRLALQGTVAGRPVERLIAAKDEPAAAGYTLEQHMDKKTKIAFANAFTLLGRLLFPSELVRALGRRRISGRLVRAWHDCCREIRIAIDEAIARPDSGGLRAWRSTLRNAVLSGLFLALLSVGFKMLLRPRQQDDFTGWLGCGFVGIGTAGAIAVAGLLLLPSRFYQCERPGLELARFFGVRSLAGIRFVAGGLLMLALLAFLLPGILLLFRA